MTTQPIVRLFILAFLFSICCCNYSSPESDLRKALQDVYAQFLEAIESEDEYIIQRTMSSNAYGKNKNYFADLRAPFSSEMKKSAKFMPELSKLRFVKTVQKGPTAALIYSKDIKDQYQPGPGIQFIFIKFVNEGIGWKYDGMYSETTSKYNPDGSKKQFSLSSLAPEYAIDGQIHPAPQLLPDAEVVGVLNIISIGYTVEVIINNRNQPVVNNTTLNTFVKGGLKYGKNSIEITCKKNAGNFRDSNRIVQPGAEAAARLRETTDRLELTIRAKRYGKDEEVFKYKPGVKTKGTHTYIFSVL